MIQPLQPLFRLGNHDFAPSKDETLVPRQLRIIRAFLFVRAFHCRGHCVHQPLFDTDSTLHKGWKRYYRHIDLVELFDRFRLIDGGAGVASGQLVGGREHRLVRVVGQTGQQPDGLFSGIGRWGRTRWRLGTLYLRLCLGRRLQLGSDLLLQRPDFLGKLPLRGFGRYERLAPLR